METIIICYLILIACIAVAVSAVLGSDGIVLTTVAGTFALVKRLTVVLELRGTIFDKLIVIAVSDGPNAVVLLCPDV